MKQRYLMQILTGVILLALVLVLSMLPDAVSHYAALLAPALLAVVTAALFINTPVAVLLGILIPVCLYFIYWNDPFVPDYPVQILSLAVTGLVTGLCFSYLNAAFPAAFLGVLSGCIVTAVSRTAYNYANDLPYSFNDCVRELFISRYAGLVLAVAVLPLIYYLTHRKQEDRVK
ncbi:MAG: hypothetical protein IJM50_01615 [Lachnospiraceae bacterium]|nr:hypothetical protein [Lachnospiraceae bacterium]